MSSGFPTRSDTNRAVIELSYFGRRGSVCIYVVKTNYGADQQLRSSVYAKTRVFLVDHNYVLFEF